MNQLSEPDPTWIVLLQHMLLLLVAEVGWRLQRLRELSAWLAGLRSAYFTL
jgi:hypothetical protein